MQNEELLIIGNGFDLSLGLPTTYKEYFCQRYDDETIEEVKGIIWRRYVVSKRFIELPNVNFWDIFFLLKYLDTKNIDKNWSNVEEDIKIFLTDKREGTILGISALKKCLRIHNDNINGDSSGFMNNSHAISLLDVLNKLEGLHEGNLDDFLIYEFQLFESDFAKYIAKCQAKDNHAYQLDANKLISNLVSNVEETSILSFNYTDLSFDCLDTLGKLTEVLIIENVHGKATQEIIFGIDYKDLNYNSTEFKYSKTYRKLLMNMKDYQHHALPQKILKIKFYGHSLADADYSYFQSIFDFYSIYNSTVVIEFFFYVFNKNMFNDILSNQLLAVTRLFSIYGETMTNKDHGKNILHKLLLENRIKITEIDSDGTLKHSYQINR